MLKVRGNAASNAESYDRYDDDPLLELPRSLDAGFLAVLSSRIERFDFDRVVMLVEEKLSSV